MRRIELIQGTNQIKEALRTSQLEFILTEVAETLLSARGAGKGDPITKFLEATKKYTLAASEFNPSAHHLSEILHLNDLTDPTFWASVTRGEPSTIIPMAEHMKFATQYLPSILDIIKPTSENLSPSEREAIISIILPEDEQHISKPARIVNAIQSIQDLYESCARLNDLPIDELVVLNLDSGSDKAIDLLGAAKAIECIKDILFQTWDRILLHKERRASERTKLVLEAIPALEGIGRLEQEQKIGREEAELLRRGIINGVSKFLETGALIPELEERSHNNPRLIVTAEPKLLTTAPRLLTTTSPNPAQEASSSRTTQNGGDNESTSQHGPSLGNLSNDEQKLLQQLLNKTRQDSPPESHPA